MRKANELLPAVLVFRQLSDVKAETYDALVKEAASLGFEPFTIDVPTRRDVLKVIDQSFLRREGLIVRLSQSTAREHGRNLSMLTLGVTDNSASFSEVVPQVSDWLGSEPEFPGASAQFFILEGAGRRHPISLAQASLWHHEPINKNNLVSITVSKFGAGVMLSRTVQRTV